MQRQKKIIKSSAESVVNDASINVFAKSAAASKGTLRQIDTTRAVKIPVPPLVTNEEKIKNLVSKLSALEESIEILKKENKKLESWLEYLEQKFDNHKHKVNILYASTGFTTIKIDNSYFKILMSDGHGKSYVTMGPSQKL